jgi:hypothetical protein
MTTPYVGYLEAKGMKIASVVIDQNEFNELVEEFRGIIEVKNNIRMVDDHINTFKKAKHVPLIKRGAKTEFIFERFGIRKNVIFASIIVRGAGEEVLANILSVTDMESLAQAAKEIRWSEEEY